MAIMYPKNISQYSPTDSEQLVYYELKQQLPDSYEVFYSVSWTYTKNGRREKSEADFIVVNPDYGYLCLEVKGGNGIRVDDNEWTLLDNVHGDRKLNKSPYEQAEASMYYFKSAFSNEFNIGYPGIFGAGVVFPFYTVENAQKFSNRPPECTIDSSEMNNLHSKIKKMFKYWGGTSYGFRIYSPNNHKAFLEIIRKRIAIDAVAGALVKYKERQLDVINRVQDGYIYFLSNIRQFYVRGGAGTGKTWIAMKMAEQEAKQQSNVLFLCSSPHLSQTVKSMISKDIDVYDIATLIGEISNESSTLNPPYYEGVLDSLKQSVKRYDAIFIDEAQDFSEEMACMSKALLKDENESRLGVFYDDVQVLRNSSFGDAFMILTPPFLLHENIRNTSNIYSWTVERTNLGTDVIVNPVEGPWPVTEIINDSNHLLLRIESVFKKFIDDENLQCTSMVILVENADCFIDQYQGSIAKWKLVKQYSNSSDEIKVSSVEDFKGLEADMILYIHDNTTSDNLNYIAYTRARYYLLEFIIK